MKKKIIAYFTTLSIAFIVFSCYTIKKISPTSGKEGEKVNALTTGTGEYIKFNKAKPAVIRQGSIIIKKETRIEQVISIEQRNIKKLNRNIRGKIVSVETNDNKYYVLLEPLSENSEKIEFIGCLFSELIELKLADIKELYVKRLNWGGTIAATALSIAAILRVIDMSKKDPVPSPPPLPPQPPPSPGFQW